VLQCVNKYRLAFLFLLASCCRIAAQEQGTAVLPAPGATEHPTDTISNDAPFIVRSIVVQGNRKTMQQIILREIPFKPGDHFKLQDLVKKFEDARRQLMNTVLFHEVIP